MRLPILAATATATAILAAGSASALPILADNLSLDSAWISSTPSDTGDGNPVITNTATTATIAWGESTGSGQSNYTFVENTAPLAAIPAADLNNFILGTFTHNNWPVNAPVISSAVLEVSLNGRAFDDINNNGVFDGGEDFLNFTLTSELTFTHNETPNSTPCDPVGGSVCDDVVSVSVTATSEVLSFGGATVSLGNAGFFLGTIDTFDPDTSSVFTSWQTLENNSNNAVLVAGANINVVPLPAGAWLLLGGFGVMAASRKRRKAS